MIKDGLQTEHKDEIHSFLMIGQSNMAGRGDLGTVPRINNPQCFMLRMGRWQAMREPINPDRSIYDGTFRSGISLGASFADKAANTLGCKVGMIPCADGGTKIDSLVAGIEDGKRSFKIYRMKPDGKSYARDIADKYGLSYENIVAFLIIKEVSV